MVRIGDVCRYDVLTKVSEFDSWTYIIWSTQVTESRQPEYTQLKAGTCPLDAKFYLFNTVTNEWDDYTTLWPTYGGALTNGFVATSNDNPPTAATLTTHF